jgi:hypothetical protein
LDGVVKVKSGGRRRERKRELELDRGMARKEDPPWGLAKEVSRGQGWTNE